MFNPHDDMILREKEALLEEAGQDLLSEVSGQSRKRLVALGTLKRNSPKKNKNAAAGNGSSVQPGEMERGRVSVSRRVADGAVDTGRQHTSSDSTSLPDGSDGSNAAAAVAAGAAAAGNGSTSDSVREWDKLQPAVKR